MIKILHLYAAVNDHGNKGIDSVDCLCEIDQLGLATNLHYLCIYSHIMISQRSASLHNTDIVISMFINTSCDM